MSKLNGKHKKETKATRIKGVVDQLDLSKVLGEVVSFNARPYAHNGVYTHQQIVAALKSCGLNHEVAKELSYENAFSRAAKSLKQDRVIDVKKQEGAVITFQLTKRALAGEDVEYSKETDLSLDTNTGVITCKIDALREKAQQELDKAVKERGTSDVTRIINKLYEDNAELIPFRDQGGCYIVLKDHMSFNDRVEAFLDQLGGRMNRLPIAAGTKKGNETIALSIEDFYTGEVEELEQVVKQFTINTRTSTMESFAERFKAARQKVLARALYLGDKQKELLKLIDSKEKTLKTQIERISTDKANAPPEQGIRSKIFGHSLTGVIRWCGANKWTYDDVRRMLSHFKIEAADSTIKSQLAAIATSGWRGEPAELSDEEEQTMWRIIGRPQPVKESKKKGKKVKV